MLRSREILKLNTTAKNFFIVPVLMVLIKVVVFVCQSRDPEEKSWGVSTQAGGCLRELAPWWPNNVRQTTTF